MRMVQLGIYFIGPSWGNMTKNEFTLPCNFTYNVNFRHVVRYELAMPCRSRNSWWQTRKEPEGSGHFSWTQLLFCVCVGVLSDFNHIRLFATPMDCGLPGSSVHGILQARILESVAISSSRGSSWPGIEPTSLMPPALAGRFFTISASWEGPSFYWFESFLRWPEIISLLGTQVDGTFSACP